MKIINFTTLSFACLLLMLSACKKNDAYRNYTATTKFDRNVYEHLQKQTPLFDSLLLIINKAGLKDTLVSQEITFFAPTDLSLLKAKENYNDKRKGQGLAELSLAQMDSSSLRQMLVHYIIRGKKLAKDFGTTNDGLDVRTIADRTMHVSPQKSNAAGVANSGSSLLRFCFMYSSKWVEDWSNTIANTTDIELKNGVVHILEAGHIFSFGNMPVRLAQKQNYWSDYYYYSYGTLTFPTTVNPNRSWGPLATAAMRDGKRITAIARDTCELLGADFLTGTNAPLFTIRLAIDAYDSVKVRPAPGATASIENNGPCYFDRKKFTFYLNYRYAGTDGIRRVTEELKLLKN